MSVAIIVYQLLIAGFIIGAAVKGGRTGCVIAAVIASLWTLTHIFMAWLMLLQFGTVAVATIIGLSIGTKKAPEPNLTQVDPPTNSHEVHESKSSKTAIITTILVTIGVLVMLTLVVDERTPTSTTSSSSKSATVAPREKPTSNPIVQSSQPNRNNSISGERKQTHSPESKVIIKKPGQNTTKEVQLMLSSLGYDPGPPDGVFGPGTRGAISKYQRDFGLYPDGYISFALLTSLREKTRTAK